MERKRKKRRKESEKKKKEKTDHQGSITPQACYSLLVPCVLGTAPEWSKVRLLFLYARPPRKVCPPPNTLEL
jgi:hypothetical protein